MFLLGPERPADADVEQRLRRALGREPPPTPDAPPDGDGGSLAAPPVPREPRRWALLVPDALRGALTSPGRAGLRALIALALVAAAGGALLVWRARPAPLPVLAPNVLASASAEVTGTVVVDVAGGVRRPGLVHLPVGSRVADAIAAAGGMLPGSTSAGLNLARKVTDGEQVLVGLPGAPVPAAPGAGAAATGPLDLNLATAEQLDGLPGVGPVLAGRIVAWREKNGRFVSVDQLGEVSGVGPKKLDGLRDLVRV